MSKNIQVKKSTNKEEIKRLYFEEHLTQVEIANIFNVSKQAISKFLRKESKIEDEKIYKHTKSIQHKKEYNQTYLKTYKRAKSTDTKEYYALQAKLDRDSVKLSSHSEISDNAFAQSNSSIYKFDKNGNKVLIPEIKSKVTNDVPKFIPAIQIALLQQGHHV